MCSKEDFDIFCLNKRITASTLSILSKNSKYEAKLKITGANYNGVWTAAADTPEQALATARLFVCLEIEKLSSSDSVNPIDELEKHCKVNNLSYKIEYSSILVENTGVNGEIRIFEIGQTKPKVVIPFVTENYDSVHSTAVQRALLYFKTS